MTGANTARVCRGQMVESTSHCFWHYTYLHLFPTPKQGAGVVVILIMIFASAFMFPCFLLNLRRCVHEGASAKRGPKSFATCPTSLIESSQLQYSRKQARMICAKYLYSQERSFARYRYNLDCFPQFHCEKKSAMVSSTDL
jgi:hypothetical protein